MFIKNEKSDYTRQVFEFRVFLHAYDTHQFSHSVMSDSLRPHEFQPARLPCPSPSPGACLNSCPLSWWCHPTISSSVFPFSSCLQSFSASGSFPVSQFFASGGQSIGVSASASGLSMNIQNIFKMGIWYSIYCYAVWFIFFYNVISIPVSVYISLYGSRRIWLQRQSFLFLLLL